MKEEPLLQFRTSIASLKPNSLHHNHACPFCEVDQLTDILAREDSIILLKNKYPVIQHAEPLLIIETDECESDLSEYSSAHLNRLMRFAMHHWLQMEASGEYVSVLFYKNHGPLSGGTIRHPHMQIIGLHDVDYTTSLKQAYFEGLPITASNGLHLNLSTEPMVGFTEFNVIMTDLEALPQFAAHIQNTVKFLLNDYHARVTSYNLFFYHYNEQFICKIVPRFPTSPLFVGFRLRQVSNNLQAIVKQYQERYGVTHKGAEES